MKCVCVKHLLGPVQRLVGLRTEKLYPTESRLNLEALLTDAVNQAFESRLERVTNGKASSRDGAERSHDDHEPSTNKPTPKEHWQDRRPAVDSETERRRNDRRRNRTTQNLTAKNRIVDDKKKTF